jgi:hypothetical protein
MAIISIVVPHTPKPCGWNKAVVVVFRGNLNGTRWVRVL